MLTTAYLGTIPKALIQSPALELFLAQNNKFVGSINTMFEGLSMKNTNLTLIDRKLKQIVVISINQCDCSLPVPSFSSLVSGNRLTGSLPANIFRESNITIFAAGKNCLHGEIPEAVCSATKLEELMLYAMSLGCSSSSMMTGTIPSCLFTMPNMRSLYLSSNNLLGSLPSDILTFSPHLINVSVSYNRMEGTIPKKLMHSKLSVLDLANNKFTGLLSDGITDNREESAEVRTSLSMKVNRLSGDIPYQTAVSYSTVDLLTGSLFGCDGRLPENDPHRHTFSCGSSGLDYSIYFLVVGCALGLVYSCFATRRPRHYMFSMLKPADGSTSKAVYDKFEEVSTWHAALSLVPPNCVNTLSFIRWLRMMKWLTLVTAALIILMSLFIYPALKSSYINSSHYVQYNWYISLAFLKGSRSAAAVLIFWAFVVTVVISAIYCYHMSVREDRHDSYRSSQWRNKTALELMNRFVTQPLLNDFKN